MAALFNNTNFNFHNLPQEIEEFSFIYDELTVSSLFNEFWRNLDKHVLKTCSSREKNLQKMIQNNQNSLRLRYIYSGNKINENDLHMSNLMCEVINRNH